MGKALVVEILGDAKHFAAELDKAAGKTRQFGKAAGVAGLAIVGGLAVGLEKSVEAAIHGEASQRALDTALKNTHQSLAAMKAPLEAAEEASRKLGFTDDDTRVALSKLETATGNTKDAISDLAIAEDVARFKHVDLDTATKLLTGTLAGNARAAKQLGIIVQPVTENMDALKEKYKELGDAIPPAEAAQAKMMDKQATAAQTIQTVNDKLHGQADAYSKTAEGGLAQFRAQTEHLEETLGRGLLPALTTIAAALSRGAAFLAEHTTATKVAIGAVASLAAILLTVSAAMKIAAAAQAIMTAAQWALNVALTANPIGIVIVAVAALGAAIVIAYQKSETFRSIVSAAFNAVKVAVSVAIGGILTYIDTWLAALQKVFEVASHIPFVGDKFKAVANAVGDAREKVQGLRSDIDALRDKTVTVTTVVQTIAATGDAIHHRAAGGPVRAGQAYIVGENRPELFVPGQNGTIVPRVPSVVGSARAGGAVVNVTVNGWVGNDQALAQRLRRELTLAGGRNVDIFGGLA